MTCKCSYIKVGWVKTDSRAWSYDCPEHGVDSPWYKSEEQAQKRQMDDRRTRAMQAEARRVRQGGTPDPDFKSKLPGGSDDYTYG